MNPFGKLRVHPERLKWSRRMKKMPAILAAAVLFLIAPCAAGQLFSQEEPKGGVLKPEQIIAKIREAKGRQEFFKACADTLAQCKAYDDYESTVSEMNRLVARQKGADTTDILYYMIAKARSEELSYLAEKNDIESGRVYMSVNEKYYNEALDNLEKADQNTKSKDLSIDTYVLRFFIFKELFQAEKADAVFSEIVNRIMSYSPDKAERIARLNEVCRKFSDKGAADDAMKLKFAYASKADEESARMLSEEIRSGADKYFDEGNIKDANSAYNTYLDMAERYYDKDATAAKLMEIAEKYFNKSRFKDAVKYYSLHLLKYGTSQVADYAAYKLAVSYYDDRDYTGAAAKFDEFLKNYPNSVWFEKSFESLCRIYYETSNTEKALGYLQKLIDAYPRRDTNDYAFLLEGILYYGKADYDKALEVFRKIQQDFSKSAYLYVTDILITDIMDIKKGASPSYSFGSEDFYRVWEPYTAVNADIVVGEGAQIVENKDANPGEIYIKTKCGSNVAFTVANPGDLDSFNEYWQDKEDISRLPREIKTGTEKDLIYFTWSSADNGKFQEDKQTTSRVWQAPDTPGHYVITVNLGDMALVRPPDSGTRKDNPKTLAIHALVEK